MSTTDAASPTTKDLEKKLDTHYGVLPHKRVVIMIWALILGAVIEMADTIGISIALPYIASDLNASKTIQWAGTVFAISNSIVTVLCGRFADIFGRKNLLLLCLVITGVFQLAQGFATNGPQFYVFRGISGLGAGGIIPISMIIIADVVKPEQRAKYQGMLGSGIGLGSCLGYFVFSGYIESTKKGWRNGFYTLCPITLTTSVVTWWILPNTKSDLSRKEILRNLDYSGVLISSAVLIFILIPLNCGGTLYGWDSTIIIVFFVLSGACFIGFILIERYLARLPIVPLRLFRSIPVDNLLIQCVLYGMAFFSICFYFPYYFTMVRGLNTMQTTGMMQCILFPLCIHSSITGRIISRFNNYNYVIWTGYSLWLLSNLLLLMLKETTSLWGLGFIMILMGQNIGWTFQPTQQAIQSQSDIKDRSVIMSLRNVLRYIGNAIGIAVSSLIFRVTIVNKVDSSTVLSTSEKLFIKSHLTVKFQMSLLTDDDTKIKHIRHIYMIAIKNLIYLWIPAIGICWLMSFFIKDKGLRSKDEQLKVQEHDELESFQVQEEHILVDDQISKLNISKV